MLRSDVKQICRDLPASEWSEPFGPGHDVWKIGGKIFVAIGSKAVGVSLKTPDGETAQMLLDIGAAQKAPYFRLPWVLVPFDAPGDELTHRITTSYAVVRASLTKKARATLPEWPPVNLS